MKFKMLSKAKQNKPACSTPSCVSAKTREPSVGREHSLIQSKRTGALSVIPENEWPNNASKTIAILFSSCLKSGNQVTFEFHMEGKSV